MAHAHLACAPDSLSDSLKEAEVLCGQRGGKLTPLRKKVLTLLLESEGPAKAYDLLEHLGDDGIERIIHPNHDARCSRRVDDGHGGDLSNVAIVGEGRRVRHPEYLPHFAELF